MGLLEKYKPAIQNKNMRQLALANLVSVCGTVSTTLALPLLAYEITGSKPIAALTILAIAAGLVFGAQVLQPRLRKLHPIPLACRADLFAGLLMVLLLTLTSLPQSWFVPISMFIIFWINALTAIHRASEQYVLKDTIENFDKDQTILLNSFFNLSTQGARALGPLIFGVIVAVGTAKHVLIIDALSFAVSALIFRRISCHFEKPKEKITLLKTLSQYPSGKILAYLGIPVLCQIGSALKESILVIHIITTLLASQAMIGVISVSNAIGIIIGTLLIGLLPRKTWYLPFTIFLIATAHFTYASTSTLLIFITLTFIDGFGFGTSAVTLSTLFQELSKKQHITTLASLRLTLMNLARLGGMGFGAFWLIGNSTTSLFWISGSILAIGSFLSFVLIARHTKEKDEESVEQGLRRQTA